MGREECLWPHKSKEEGKASALIETESDLKEGRWSETEER